MRFLTMIQNHYQIEATDEVDKLVDKFLEYMGKESAHTRDAKRRPDKIQRFVAKKSAVNLKKADEVFERLVEKLGSEDIAMDVIKKREQRQKKNTSRIRVQRDSIRDLIKLIDSR